jgi:hypothetical protein
MSKAAGVGSTGPPRTAEEVIAAALADDELMRQVRNSLDDLRRGDHGTPLKELQAKHRRARSA